MRGRQPYGGGAVGVGGAGIEVGAGGVAAVVTRDVVVVVVVEARLDSKDF